MKVIITPDEAFERGIWDKLCELKGFNPYAVSEGLIEGTEEITLSYEEAKELNLLETK